MARCHVLTGSYVDRRFADHDTAALRIRDAYLAGFSAWAGRAELAGALDAAHDIAAVVVAASYRRCPPAVLPAHPRMREMPAFCLSGILARRVAGSKQCFKRERSPAAQCQRSFPAIQAAARPSKDRHAHRYHSGTNGVWVPWTTVSQSACSSQPAARTLLDHR